MPSALVRQLWPFEMKTEPDVDLSTHHFCTTTPIHSVFFLKTNVQFHTRLRKCYQWHVSNNSINTRTSDGVKPGDSPHTCHTFTILTHRHVHRANNYRRVGPILQCSLIYQSQFTPVTCRPPWSLQIKLIKQDFGPVEATFSKTQSQSCKFVIIKTWSDTERQIVNFEFQRIIKIVNCGDLSVSRYWATCSKILVLRGTKFKWHINVCVSSCVSRPTQFCNLLH